MTEPNVTPTPGSKIRVLVVPSDRTGVGKFRSIDPHVKLETLYPDDFTVTIDYAPKLHEDDFLKSYDIIHFHRTLGPFEGMENLMGKLRHFGVKTVLDLDDYWLPPSEHPAFLLIKQDNLDKKISENLRHPDYVMTTTSIFADEIKKFNKNVVVFPNAIDPSEKQYQSDTTRTDRLRIGWLGGSCYDDQTEILTDQGWKYFKDLNKSEKVATLNPETGTMEYHAPTSYIAQPFMGDLQSVSTKNVDYAVTPNHNMYVSRVGSLTHKRPNFELIPSENLYGTNFHCKKDATWEGKERDVFLLPGVQNDSPHHPDAPEKIIAMDDWLKFFGFWLADGWTETGNQQVGICQFKSFDVLEELCEIMGKYGFEPYVNPNAPGQHRYCNKQLWSYLRLLGKAKDKFIPREFLNLSTRQLNILLEWYLKGDGHTDPNGRSRAWTVSKQLADDLMEIALKTGNAASIKNRGRKGANYIKENRVISGTTDVYQIGFYNKSAKHNQLNPLVRVKDHFTVPYDGIVYCVEVQNHVIYVRRNGKGFWCGNSHLADLEPLRSLQVLHTDYRDKMQIVLCGFDTRGKFTTINQQTGERQQRDIKPEETVWARYEELFTDNYNLVTPEYRDFLKKYKKDGFNDENEPYRRVWTKPITTYASNYRMFDVSLAPLRENVFNYVKSNLKVIEAGFHKRAFIGQNYGPYTVDIIDAFEKGGTINPTGNGILIDTVHNHKGWHKAVKKLLDNPNLAYDLGEKLYETVKDKYHLDTVSRARAQFYKSIV